jgi:hypothetical protein
MGFKELYDACVKIAAISVTVRRVAVGVAA